MVVGITAGGEHLVARIQDALAAGIDRVIVREAALPVGIERLATEHPGRLVLHARMPGAVALAGSLPVGLHFAGDAPPAAWTGTFSVSTHSVAEARRARDAGAAWVLLSPIWPPSSKPGDTRPPLGVGVLGEVAGCVALGGVTPARIAACRAAGAFGVAGLGGLFGAADVGEAVRAWRDAWGAAQNVKTSSS